MPASAFCSRFPEKDLRGSRPLRFSALKAERKLLSFQAVSSLSGGANAGGSVPVSTKDETEVGDGFRLGSQVRPSGTTIVERPLWLPEAAVTLYFPGSRAVNVPSREIRAGRCSVTL